MSNAARADCLTACVFGASGGIGGALVARLAADPAIAVIHAGARTAIEAAPGIRPFRFELTDEDSIAEAAAAIGPVDVVIVATGVLHGDGLAPEKSLRAQSPESYARAFAINATGPALIAKHFVPLLPRDRRSVFAVLSARVGSTSDNRAGGWHAYRASKAALNMIVRNIAIELGRTHKDAVVVTLHPGTVATPLSAPFQRNVAAEILFTAEDAAAKLLAVIAGLTATDSGNLFGWDGQRIAF